MNDHEGDAEKKNVYRLNKANLDCSDTKRSSLFFKKSSKTTLLLFIFSIIMVSLAATVVTLWYLYQKSPKPIDLCDSESCLRTAASLKETMDTSVDPCDDFYKYTCGRWSEAYPAPGVNQMNSWWREKALRSFSTIKELLAKNVTEDEPESTKKAKTFFASCMNQDARDKVRLDTLFEQMTEMEVPLIPASFTKNSSQLEYQLANVKRNYWIDVFFGVQITEDPLDPHRNMIEFSQYISNYFYPSLNVRKSKMSYVKDEFPDVIEELCEDQKEKEESKAKQIMFNVFKYVIVNATVYANNITYNASCDSEDLNSIMPFTDDEIRDTVDQLWNLQEQINNLTEKYENISRHKKDDPKSLSHYLKLDDLVEVTENYIRSKNETLVPNLFWKPFVKELTKSVESYDLDRQIYVHSVYFFKELALLLAKTDEHLLETAIWWSLVENFIPQSKELRDIYFNNRNDPSMGPISQFCVALTDEFMSIAVARMAYNSSLIDKHASENVRGMLENVRMSFLKYLGTADWLDQDAKKDYSEKSKKMRALIGFPDWGEMGDALDFYYSQIPMSNETYYANKRGLIRMATSSILNALQSTEINYKGFWLQTLMIINAFYEPDKNQMVIPAGILQFPYYNLGLESMNYGAIGAILGHELTHGFDNHSKTYDQDGNEKLSLNQGTLKNYTNLSQCFIDQYSRFTFNGTADRINGSRTLNENIADNGGLRQVYVAYQTWKSKNKKEPQLPGFTHLSHEQLLFLAYANTWCWTYYPQNLKYVLHDAHSPPNARVNVGLQNSKYFSEAWNCPLGSKMNPVKKCHLW